MYKKILLEQEHKPTGFKVFLTSMEDTHIKHLIKLAQDESLIDLLGRSTSFKPDDTEQFIESILNCTFPYSRRKSQPLVFGVYLALESWPIG
ncbi:MAG: hypothetical protein SWX82_07065 [Cyanobacteriota bacterium]|nr:hypothetical protein [Cyanobacteriota bacterium]